MPVDDLRSFIDGRRAQVARTSAAGVDLLHRYRDQRLDELWLDHNLGDDYTIWPVVEVLERTAFDGHRFDIGIINVHSANPAGAAKVTQVLSRARARRQSQLVAVPSMPGWASVKFR